MIARLPLAFAAASALFTAVAAQLQVIEPGGPTFWWIANSENLLVWNCNESQVQNFTVLVANPDMASALAIIAQQPNFVCSLLVTKDQMGALPVGTGYTVQLADPLNNTNVYAASQSFEIKAAGSAYPTSSSAIESATFTPSSSGSGSAATSTGSTKSNDGLSLTAATGLGTALVGAVVGLFAL